MIDLHSRRIVGWAMKPSLAKDLVVDALLMAVWQQPKQTVIVHSRQGSQYGRDAWLRLSGSPANAEHVAPGQLLGQRGRRSFFSSLKKERVKKRIYRTRRDARADIFDFIEALHRKQRHSQLGDVSLEAF